MTTQGTSIPRASRSKVQEMNAHTDTRDTLRNFGHDRKAFNMDDYFIVDVDSHIVETDVWDEVLECIEDPVLRYNGKAMAANWPVSRKIALHNEPVGMMYQDVQGRVPHGASLQEKIEDKSVNRELTLVRRALESMPFDIQVVFPQPLLEIGLHPNPQIGDELVVAFNNWFMERILPKDDRLRSLLPLPFNNPDKCIATINKYKNHPKVIGFMVTSQRPIAVHDNKYMKVYRLLEEIGKPIAFHAGPTQTDGMTMHMNRFLSVHAMSFVTCNMMHLTNWLFNGLPERFPNLKVIWVESGLAWIPFMHQRLDTEYLKRQSDAPSLKKLPSDYMREMYFTSQPFEDASHAILELTLDIMNAETQLLYSSDWPHWDFDLPVHLFELPFVSENARRNILGENARKLFGL